METNHFERAWAELVAKVWKDADPAARRQLLADPKAAFAALGAAIPAGVEVVMIQNTPGKVHFVLPPKPESLLAITDQKLTELYRACPGTVCATGGTGGA